MSRPGLYWIIAGVSAFATLFPDLVAHRVLDDRRIVRWLAIPLFLASTTLLVSFHTRLF